MRGKKASRSPQPPFAKVGSRGSSHREAANWAIQATSMRKTSGSLFPAERGTTRLCRRSPVSMGCRSNSTSIPVPASNSRTSSSQKSKSADAPPTAKVTVFASAATPPVGAIVSHAARSARSAFRAFMASPCFDFPEFVSKYDDTLGGKRTSCFYLASPSAVPSCLRGIAGFLPDRSCDAHHDPPALADQCGSFPSRGGSLRTAGSRSESVPYLSRSMV